MQCEFDPDQINLGEDRPDQRAFSASLVPVQRFWQGWKKLVLGANQQADDQRRNGKDAENAAQYHHQPKRPATVALDNFKGYIGQIGEVLPRHRGSLKPLEDRSIDCFGALLPYRARDSVMGVLAAS